jgi:hypothetical protein
MGGQRTKRRDGARRRPAGQEDIWRRPAAKADEGHAAAQRLQLDVPAWPPAPDQLQLAQQGGELAGLRFPHNRLGLTNDPGRPAVAALDSKVAQKAGAQILRFADVDDLAVLVEHAVDARFARAEAADFAAKLPGAFARCLLTGTERLCEAGRAEAFEGTGEQQAGHGGSFLGKEAL